MRPATVVAIPATSADHDSAPRPTRATASIDRGEEGDARRIDHARQAASATPATPALTPNQPTIISSIATEAVEAAAPRAERPGGEGAQRHAGPLADHPLADRERREQGDAREQRRYQPPPRSPSPSPPPVMSAAGLVPMPTHGPTRPSQPSLLHRATVSCGAWASGPPTRRASSAGRTSAPPTRRAPSPSTRACSAGSRVEMPGGGGYTLMRLDGADVCGLYGLPADVRTMPSWTSWVSVEDAVGARRARRRARCGRGARRARGDGSRPLGRDHRSPGRRGRPLGARLLRRAPAG